MGVFTDIIYEVDLRERKTGNSVECIYSGEDREEAYDIANMYNSEKYPNLEYEDFEEFCDMESDGLFADVYYIEAGAEVRGVGKIPGGTIDIALVDTREVF